MLEMKLILEEVAQMKVQGWETMGCARSILKNTCSAGCS